MNFCLDARTAHDHFPGVGRYTVNLARALVPGLDASETLIVLRDPSRPSPWDLSTLGGARLRLVDMAVSPFSAHQQWAVPRRLRQLNVGLYHSPYYLMPFRPGVDAVVTLHDLIPLCYPGYFTRLQRLIFALTVRLAVRAARTVIVDSASTAADVQRLLRVPAQRVAVIPAAADPIFSPQPADADAAVRGHLHLPPRYVLYVGSNKPHKNLPRLVEAWARLRPQAVPLVIAGLWDARYLQARQRAEALQLGDAVRFAGAVRDDVLPALYRGATLFVFPSEYEGFGLPVLEAMACGAPVACSRAASLREVAGEAAAYFDPLGVESIADAIAGLLGDDSGRAELAQRGLERAAGFSWDETARRTLQVYRRR